MTIIVQKTKDKTQKRKTKSLGKDFISKVVELIKKLREHCENAKERKTYVNKIALWICDLRSQFSFTRQHRLVILEN